MPQIFHLYSLIRVLTAPIVTQVNPIVITVHPTILEELIIILNAM